MDDFLHNLRMSKDRRFDRGRRPHDHQNYRKGRVQDNRKGNYRKSSGVDRVTALLGESLPEIKSTLNELVEQQKHLVQIAERREQAEKRQALALEQIAQALTGSGTLIPQKEYPEQAVTTPPLSLVETIQKSDENTAALPPDESTIIDLIQAMRAKGLSYSKIADDLNAQKMPTISGRGKWRGPMVSKLCRESE